MTGDQRQQTLDIMKQDTDEVAAKVASGAY